MTNPKPRAGRASKKPDTDQQTDGQAKQVLIRLDQDEKDVLTAATQANNLTQSEFFTHLLRFFKSLPAKEREKIAKGLGESPIQEMTRLLTLVNAANHSFSVKRWLRCLDDHRELLDEAKDYDDLKDWILYRLGYVWHSNAYELRLRGLKLYREWKDKPRELGKQYLLLAMDALEEASNDGKKVKRSMRVQALFNRICHRSFAAQIRMELAVVTGEVENLDREDAAIVPTSTYKQCAEALLIPGEKGAATPIPSFVPQLPELFDTLVERHPTSPTVQLIMGLTGDAVRSLEQLVKVANSRKFEGTSLWLSNSLDVDPDLGFVRSIRQPKNQKKEYNDLLEKLRGSNSEERMISFIQKRLSHLHWSGATESR